MSRYDLYDYLYDCLRTTNTKAGREIRKFEQIIMETQMRLQNDSNGF